jgi:hypothetical protein
MQDPNAAENRNPDGVLRYKKIKMHESRSHAVNPWKGGKVTVAQVRIFRVYNFLDCSERPDCCWQSLQTDASLL